MRAAVASRNLLNDRETETGGVCLPLIGLDEPGTYVCDWSGHLLRMPERDPDRGRFARIGHTDLEPRTVTRISTDPRISQGKARALARSYGLSANF